MIKRIKKKPILMSTIVFFTLFLFSLVCLIYSILRIPNIEDLLRYMVCGLLVLIIIYILLNVIKIIFKGKNAGIIMLNIILVIMFVSSSYIAITINNIYNSINNIYKSNITYEASLIGLIDNKISIKDVKNKKIAVVKKDDNEDLFDVSNMILDSYDLNSTNEIIRYDNISDIIKYLYSNDVDLAIVPSNYTSIYSTIDEYHDISEKTYQITSKSKSIKKVSNVVQKDEKDPISILILGIDSTIKDISSVTSFNADTIMLATFNPNTFNTTILSIPRDTYVPIVCNNNLESKITHSGWNGEKCVIKTLENLTTINIDYYIKVNFAAVVNLVDEIGGIEIDVPYNFCEQDSNRRWKENTIYVEKGKHLLNGEQVLAFARNRHPNPRCGEKWSNYYSSDLVRGENQQLILNALVNKLVKSFNIEKMNSILNIIGTNADTNMNINEMTSYYNLLKKTFDGDTKLNFQRLNLSTYGKSLYDPLLNMGGMSMQIYYKDSLNEIIKEMKTNLELEEPNIIKTFNFSINNPYKEKIIGKGEYYQSDIEIVPNFIGKDLSIVQNFANTYGIKLNIEYQDTNEKVNNSIISQEFISTYRIDKLDRNKSYKIVVARNSLPIENNVTDIFINE